MVTLQQDGAPSRRSIHTLAVLQTNVYDFIEPSNWLSNSSHLILRIIQFWGVLQQLLYRQKLKNIDRLKQVLNSCWDKIYHARTNPWSIDQWSKRLLLVAHSHGGQFEDRFPLILWSVLVANYFCHELHCCRYWCFWVVHLQSSKQRISNNFWTFQWKPLCDSRS